MAQLHCVSGQNLKHAQREVDDLRRKLATAAPSTETADQLAKLQAVAHNPPTAPSQRTLTRLYSSVLISPSIVLTIARRIADAFDIDLIFVKCLVESMRVDKS